jgi:cell wall-associated NlpC family hydrolase
MELGQIARHEVIHFVLGGVRQLEKSSKRPNLADLIGKPFKSGGRGPDEYDCFGLAKEVFRRYGIELPDYRIMPEQIEIINEVIQIHVGWEPVDPKNLPVPCLITLRFNSEYSNHVATYIGHGSFIHIAEKIGVHQSQIDNPMWRHNITGYWLPEKVKYID